MGNYNLYKVLNVFFDDPIKDFQLRQISRMIKLEHKSVLIYLKKLVKLGLIKINTSTLYKSYNSNTENEIFKKYKKIFNQLKISESGLIEFLDNELMPEVIILFGGYAKGTDVKDSDIDIFIQSKQQKINLDKFEKILKRKIHLVFDKDLKYMSKELKNNITNGIILSGNLRLFR